MKSIFFHLMPYRDLPADFEQRYESIWVTPPNTELCDPRQVAQYYQWNLDVIGCPTVWAEAWILQCATAALRRLGLGPESVRVLVGRTEIMTPAFERRLLADFTSATEEKPNPWLHDRYFPAYAARVKQLGGQTAAR